MRMARGAGFGAWFRAGAAHRLRFSWRVRVGFELHSGPLARALLWPARGSVLHFYVFAATDFDFEVGRP
jgi:hypothetical protein